MPTSLLSRDLLLLVDSPIYLLGMTFCGVEHPFGQLRSPLLAMLPPRFLCNSSLAQHETLNSPWLRVSRAQQKPNQQHVVNIIFTLKTTALYLLIS